MTKNNTPEALQKIVENVSTGTPHPHFQWNLAPSQTYISL